METQEILARLAGIKDPVTGRSLNAVPGSVRVDGETVSIFLDYPARRFVEPVAQMAKEALKGAGVQIAVSQRIQAHAAQLGVKVRSNIRNIIAVSSCKGGVGKSTVAANLALALSRDGARVGLFDADIHGPSVPSIFGFEGASVVSEDGETVKPFEVLGLQLMSVGVLLERDDEPLIMRGPMLAGTMQQLLDQTAWDDLDYLVIDMPPGTGDIQLTLAQSIPVTSAVIVTTPQDLALLDVRKGIRMFEKLNVPVAGVVENMSGYVCPKCGHFEAIFGQGGAEKLAAQYGIKVLGHLPLEMQVRLDTESGVPTVAAHPEGATAKLYEAIAQGVAATLASRDKDHSLKMPTIQVASD